MSKSRPVPWAGLSILKPMPPPLLAAAALVVLVAGAAYCLGYELLRSGYGEWTLSLLWSACAVLPWLALFELVKRREWRTGRRLPPLVLAALLILTGIVSLLLEGASDLLLDRAAAPLGLELLRRLPAAAATMLLLFLARHQSSPVATSPVRAPPESEAEMLRRHAPSIRWIRAADNYLELHLETQVVTRRLTMREAEMILAPLGFVRIHRSTIVNRDYVRDVLRNGGTAVRLADGTLLPAGQAYASNLPELENFAPSPQKV